MRRSAWLVGAVVAVAGVLFLAVFPARAWWAQRGERERVQAQLTTLTAKNRVLEQRAALLGSDAEVERLARSQYGLAKPGEKTYLVLPAAGAPDALRLPPPMAVRAPPKPPAPRHPQSWWDKLSSLF